MTGVTIAERALVLAPRGRDGTIAAGMLDESGIVAAVCTSIPALVDELDRGAGFVLVTEEAITTADLHPLRAWIDGQEEWSDLPFILLTSRGGGLERNPAAGRYLTVLGNVTFLERPFHPTTMVSLARSALRGRQRQYEARARLAALRESEMRYRTLFESIDEGFCVIQFIDGPEGALSDYIHIEANPAYEANAGIPEIVGKRLREIVSQSEADAWAEIYRRVLVAGEPVRFERELVETGRHLELAAFRIEPPERRQVAVLFRDVSARKRAESQLRDLNETLEGRVARAIDERQAAMTQLHEAQKLETLGQLTGGVAHDFNNLLTPIMGAVDIVAKRYADDPRSARLLDGALQSAERAKTLVQRLLGFARRQALETRPVNLAELVHSMRDLIASSIGSAIELRIRVQDDLQLALVDPNQLELAVLNLCVNARDAMPSGGALTLVLEAATVAPTDAVPVAPGAYLRLSVIDTGFGMDEATLARAVEPFYSTKGIGKGTGLGLSMVHGLAAQLGGAFLLTSTPGEGTRADLYLPVATAAWAGAAPARPSATPATADRSLSILLVDDEELVRTGTAEMLREMGHEVAEASGGGQALGKLGSGLAVDAIVTDFMMPGMDGAELARRVRDRHPAIPVLVITGYAGGDLDTGLPQLAKPFRQADLAAALNQLVAPIQQAVPMPLGEA